MNTITEPNTTAEPHALTESRPPATRRGWWTRLLASKFLFVSIIVHVLFGIGATYLIVQRTSARKKPTFQAAGRPLDNPNKRALEHKVSVAKKKAGGAPPQARRIATAGLAKVSLPELPAISTTATVVPGLAAGMGGMGLGQGLGLGNGLGSGMGGDGGGGGMTMFGFRNANGGGLAGEFYDLKQTKGRQPSGVNHKQYGEIVADFVKKGWPENAFSEFYKAPKALYATQLLIPDIDAKDGPKAFAVEKEVKPEQWVCLYQGSVVAPESGTFHFVGGGDDILFVKFNGKTVLNACWWSGTCPEIKSEARYNYGWPQAGGFSKGAGFQAEAGHAYPIEILIGEWPGNKTHFVLLIEKDGAQYEKEAHGSPVLPVFRMAKVQEPPLEAKQTLPPHLSDGPVWRAQGSPQASLLDALRH